MKQLFVLVSLLSLPLAACKKAESPAAGDDACATAAAHVTELAMGDKHGKPKVPPTTDPKEAEMEAKLVPAMKTALSSRCREDKWPDAFVACTSAAADGDKLSECMKGPSKLSKDQSDKMVQAMAQVAESTAPGATKTYLDKSKKTEAALYLHRLGKNAKVYFVTNAEFPKGDAAPLPAPPCCSAPDHKCPMSTAWGADKVWSTLDFQIDEPNRFQYAYHSDGQTFTATAVGDLDCDGKAITYTLTGSAGGGNPTVQLVEPPAAP